MNKKIIKFYPFFAIVMISLISTAFSSKDNSITKISDLIGLVESEYQIEIVEIELGKLKKGFALKKVKLLDGYLLTKKELKEIEGLSRTRLVEPGP
jgi:hypothetical protein